MTYIVYKTINLVNGNFYIGVHKCRDEEDNYLGSGTALFRAIKKYGKNNFKRETLKSFSRETDALEYEKELVNEDLLISPNCYNIVIGGGKPPSRSGKVSATQLLKGENRTVAQKQQSSLHSERMRVNKPWNKDKTGLQEAWNKGAGTNPSAFKTTLVNLKCPHCGKEGIGSSMYRWHFDNCKFRAGA